MIRISRLLVGFFCLLLALVRGSAGIVQFETEVDFIAYWPQDVGLTLLNPTDLSASMLQPALITDSTYRVLQYEKLSQSDELSLILRRPWRESYQNTIALLDVSHALIEPIFTYNPYETGIYPVWSLGRRTYVHQDANNRNTLHFSSLHQGEIWSHEFGYDWRPVSWSSNGRWLALYTSYRSFLGETVEKIATVDMIAPLDSQPFLTFDGTHNPSWSRSGTQLVYAFKNDWISQIRVMDVESGQSRLIHEGYGNRPMWAQNDQVVMYIGWTRQGYAIRRIELQTLEDQQIIEAPIILAYDVSPSGDSIVVILSPNIFDYQICVVELQTLATDCIDTPPDFFVYWDS